MLHLDHTTSQKSLIHVAVAAGIAGAVGRLTTAPVDVIKVNTQVGVAECRQGILYSFINILRLEGPRGFLKGALVGGARAAPFAAVQFGAWDPLRIQLEQNTIFPLRRYYQRYFPASAGLSGAITTVAATTLTYPLDVIKTRAIAQSLQPKLRYSSSLLELVKNMTVREGVMSMLRGIPVSIIGAGMFGFTMFGVKDVLDEWLWFETRYELKWWQALFNCITAASVAHGAAFPFDVIRKKQQAYSTELPKFGRGDLKPFNGSLIDCVKQIYEQQGTTGYVKGLVPNMVRVVPASVGMFVAFKVLCP